MTRGDHAGRSFASAVSPCRSCEALPRAQVSHAESHRLPATWRPIDEHPDLQPGPWVPIGEMKGIVFCEACGALWYLFLDPGQDYYTDVIQMAPELARLISQDAALEDVLPVAYSGDAMLQLIIRDWFALADYDSSRAAQSLVDQLRVPDLPSRRAIRLLDFLAAVIVGSSRETPVVIDDVTPVVALLHRGDLLALDDVRRASERNEIQRQVAVIARAAFGRAFGAGRDRVRTAGTARARIIDIVQSRLPEPVAPVLAPPGPPVESRVFAGIEQLALEIEELVRDGASRVTEQEIAPLIDVVERFWTDGSASTNRTPGLELYRRCRDLLFALRHANLIPADSEQEVAAALTIPVFEGPGA